MSDVKFSPFVPNGTVNVPPSKSDVHRAIICAAMANGVSRISPVALSNDIKATIGCIKALGADAVLENNVLTVDGTNMYKNKTALLDCGESGSTFSTEGAIPKLHCKIAPPSTPYPIFNNSF